MSHQKADGEIAFASLKFGKIFGDGIVNAKFPLLKQPHNTGRSGRDFSKRGYIEDGVHLHRLASGRERTKAVTLLKNHLIVVTNNQYRARNQVGLDGILHHRVNVREIWYWRSGRGFALTGTKVNKDNGCNK
jgi:hypothetical protein